MNNFNNTQIITSFKDLMKTFSGDTNLNINQVTFTSVDNLNGGVLNDDNTVLSLSYPLLNSMVETATISKNVLTIPFEITYFDRLMKDGSNLTKIWDDGLSSFGYILRTLELNKDFIFNNEETLLECFKFDLDDETAGVKATVNIKFDISYCGKK
jgi:hypothetical protein